MSLRTCKGAALNGSIEFDFMQRRGGRGNDGGKSF